MEVLCSRQKQISENNLKMKAVSLLGGIGFTTLIAGIGWGLSYFPGFQKVGAMAIAIIIAVIYRQLWDYPETFRSGIDFSSKNILKIAIVLYGLKLNIQLILQEGLGLVAIDALVITFAVGVSVLIGKKIKADPTLSLLIGIGTGVCGAAAIAAVSPIIKPKSEDTAIAVGMIALIGTIFALMYSFFFPFMPIDSETYGIWSGISLHEIANVALAAQIAGQDALAIALLAKLGRVFLLIPLCFILMYWMKRKGGKDEKTAIPFPWFLIGFVIMSVIGNYVITYQPMGLHKLIDPIAGVSRFLLTMAMVGLGLNIHLHQIRTKALKPLVVLGITSVLLAGVALILIK